MSDKQETGENVVAEDRVNRNSGGGINPALPADREANDQKPGRDNVRGLSPTPVSAFPDFRAGASD